MKKNYFNSLNINFFHGIMFHHFHDRNMHKKSQGSISAKEFEKILNFIGFENILDPKVFIDLLKNNKLKKKHVCLTFDDNLKSQFDIALPVLEKHNLKAFFFVYSSSLTKKPDLLELFRYFRTNYYKSVNLFYKDFNKEVINKYGKNKIDNFFKNNKKKILSWKSNFKIYTVQDIKFRFLRDRFLLKREYEKFMFNLFASKKFDYKKILKKLFMNSKDLNKLSKLGHEIGLHSNSHPTRLGDLSKIHQLTEYNTNKKILKSFVKKIDIISMSHPCGSYNQNTINILKNMKIQVGFRSDLKKKNNSSLEIARMDHSIINKYLKN